MLQQRTGVRFFGALSRHSPFPRPKAKLRFWIGPAALMMVTSLVGCSGGSVALGNRETAVSIDGEEIQFDVFRQQALKSLPKEMASPDQEEEVDAQVWSALFDQFLDSQLLIRLAIERGLVDGEVDEKRAIHYLLRDTESDPALREIEVYYQARRKDFERSERVRLRQILVDDHGLARQAQDALLAGEDFVDVAARLSQGPTAHLGGDQGILSREDLPAKFVDLIFSLEPGEVSGIVNSDYGYQIFQVEVRLAAEIIPLEDATATIREELQRRSVDEQVIGLLSEARERYHLTLYPSHIPFDYRGFYASHQAE